MEFRHFEPGQSITLKSLTARVDNPATATRKHWIGFSFRGPIDVYFYFAPEAAGGPAAAGARDEFLYSIVIVMRGQRYIYNHGDLDEILRTFEAAYRDPSTRDSFEYTFTKPASGGRRKRKSRKTKKNGKRRRNL